ncbi:hypothetical protein GO013_13125 [Pseudodesulfovibrio sp. JC047]|uniref:hypothetical protein n=1 Tax=Pseudodesulfovibrio sp. JC047 TaxID=2683199 RepID=UPI0013D83436|nr:hypothetical protein [Pseudodesulfovibrio sp. JC047]NDV20352.1 hypothetical protein [Pseudodesulfovibrio sp. JC047]
MAVQSIGSNGYMDAYALLQAANEEQQLQSRATEMDKEQGKTSGKSGIANEIESYLAKIPKGKDNRLSFLDVDKHRAQLEAKWDITVTADLKELGVDVTKQLPLSYDPATGKVTVAKGHEDKEIIDKYFEDNPDKVDEFKTILQLGKLTSTASAKLSQGQMIQDLQVKSMTWWFADNSDPTSWFDGGGLMFGQGQTAYTGLNITV